MSTCQVLRCTTDASSVLPVNVHGGPLLEAVVCGDHRAKIDAGAAWDCQSDGGGPFIILMGQDATSRLENWETNEFGATSESGEGLTLKFHLSRGGDPIDISSVFVTYEQAAGLGEWLSQLGRRAE